MASWAIITTLKEPKFVTLRFVEFHLAQGAAQIYLFLDDPRDPAIPELLEEPRVKLQICDDTYWQNLQLRPKNPTHRQTLNARWIYPQIEAKWCIHMDGDEFLFANEAIADSLETVGTPATQIQPFEMTICEGNLLFHGQIRNHSEINNTRFEAPPYGLLSHSAGKYFCKTGLETLELAIHAPRIDGVKARGNALKKISLLHYNNFHRDLWVNKTENRIKAGLYDRGPMKNTRLRYQNYEDTIEAHWKLIYQTEGREGLKQYYDAFTNLSFANVQALVPYTDFVEPTDVPVTLEEIETELVAAKVRHK